MNAALLLSLALVSTLPALGQITARRLTRNVAPQPQQPAPVRPAAPQYAPGAPATPQRPPTEKEIARIKADKSKNEVKQFDFYKKRAEEGSDHAQYELGMRYLTGKGTDPSEKLGREWLAKSAKQGYSQAKKKLEELGPERAAEVKPAQPLATPAPARTPETKTSSK
jgi:hypothetical protein